MMLVRELQRSLSLHDSKPRLDSISATVYPRAVSFMSYTYSRYIVFSYCGEVCGDESAAATFTINNEQFPVLKDWLARLAKDTELRFCVNFSPDSMSIEADSGAGFDTGYAISRPMDIYYPTENIHQIVKFSGLISREDAQRIRDDSVVLTMTDRGEIEIGNLGSKPIVCEASYLNKKFQRDLYTVVSWKFNRFVRMAMGNQLEIRMQGLGNLKVIDRVGKAAAW